MKPKKKPAKLGNGTRSYAETVTASIDRSNVLFVAPDDSRLYLSAFTRKRIVEKVQWCRQNFGIVQEWGKGIARHTVGKGIIPAFNTPDKEWNRAATLAAEHYLLSPSQCDVAGRRNAYEMQAHIAEQLVIVGEAFVLHSENPDFPSPKNGVGECPAFYAIDPNDVATPPTAKVPVHDGIEIGDFGRAVRYFVKLSADNYAPYDARDVAHIFEAHGTNQSRGVSPLAPGVNNLVDIHELKRLETKTAKTQRLISLVLKGTKARAGRGAFAKLSNDGEADAADTQAVENLYQGAGAAIARLGADGDVQLISGNTPSPLVNEYVTDLLLRDAAAATGVPIEFFWSRDKLGGANARGIFAQADAAFSLLADKVIYGWFEKLIIRFIEWRVASGLLPAPPEGWRDAISYRRPRRVTLDNGRDSKSRIEEINNGLANMRSVYDEQGEDYRPHMEQWIEEPIEFLEHLKRRAQEKGLSESETIWIRSMWRPLPPGSGAMDAQGTQTESSPSQHEEDMANSQAVKQKADAYGVAVRAGAITPQEDDEDTFRDALNLPKKSQPVSNAWQKDGGVRRPITLQIAGQTTQQPPAQTDPEENDATEP